MNVSSLTSPIRWVVVVQGGSTENAVNLYLWPTAGNGFAYSFDLSKAILFGTAEEADKAKGRVAAWLPEQKTDEIEIIKVSLQGSTITLLGVDR